MKHDFTYHNPTKIHFGKSALDHLEPELAHYGENVLLIYGGSSLKAFGLYEKITEILKRSGKRVAELAGIPSNPTYDKVLEGAALVREQKTDLILAAGGGSVIDAAKAVSAAAYCPQDPWERYWIRQEEPDHPLVPLASILTMAGTGSEMNGGSVITNTMQKLKIGKTFGPALYPCFSILNPEYTYTVPTYQMKSGIFDIMSHLMEQYFGGEEESTSDYLIEGLLRSLIASTPKALRNERDYAARSDIMWTSTVALNTLVGKGKEQDWEVHMIEHQLGAYTSCAHGMGLAAISIPYYRYIYRYGLKKFARFARNVWGLRGEDEEALALGGLDCLESFIRESGMVTSLRELGASEEMLEKIAESSYKGGGYKKMEKEDILAVLKACY